MMTPGSEAELSEMVRGATGPLHIQGGGTRGIECPGTPLSTAGLQGITLYEPGALTLVVQAGTPVDTIVETLAGENQRLAFEPSDYRGLMESTGTPTIGGVVAANNSGPRRIQVGACRDFMLGVRYVDGSGAVIRNGGRVMKNVTGYDLVKLMTGSWGTLGILSEVSLKVLPRAETQATLAIATDAIDTAVRAMSAALGSPFEVSGAAYDPQKGEIYIRVEGFENSVRYRMGRLRDLLSGNGEMAEAADSAALWKSIRDVAPMHNQPGDIWRISVKPSDASAVATRLNADQLLLDWGGGLIWARTKAGEDVRAALQGLQGHATLIRGNTSQHSMFQPEPAPLAAISAGLRQKFDPRGILNAGLMG